MTFGHEIVRRSLESMTRGKRNVSLHLRTKPHGRRSVMLVDEKMRHFRKFGRR